MTSKSNLPQSVRDRLLNIAKDRGEDYNHILIRYGLERVLYRLSESKFRDDFVLKGATLFIYWYGKTHRPTLDMDLHSNEKLKISDMQRITKEVCQVDVQGDGLRFDLDTLRGEEIREGKAYRGVRVKLKAKLGKADVPIQLDVGFGDSLAPGTELIVFPTLLDFPSPKLQAYRPVTSIAEKCQFMVEAGVFNSRMKDYYDVWFLCNEFQFEGTSLKKAIESTFNRRKTKVPEEIPASLTADFFENSQKLDQWGGFLERNNMSTKDLSLREVVNELREFLLPVFNSISSGKTLEKKWLPSEGWVQD